MLLLCLCMHSLKFIHAINESVKDARMQKICSRECHHSGHCSSFAYQPFSKTSLASLVDWGREHGVITIQDNFFFLAWTYNIHSKSSTKAINCLKPFGNWFVAFSCLTIS